MLKLEMSEYAVRNEGESESQFEANITAIAGVANELPNGPISSD